MRICQNSGETQGCSKRNKRKNQTKFKFFHLGTGLGIMYIWLGLEPNLTKISDRFGFPWELRFQIRHINHEKTYIHFNTPVPKLCDCVFDTRIFQASNKSNKLIKQSYWAIGAATKAVDFAIEKPGYRKLALFPSRIQGQSTTL